VRSYCEAYMLILLRAHVHLYCEVCMYAHTVKLKCLLTLARASREWAGAAGAGSVLMDVTPLSG